MAVVSRKTDVTTVLLASDEPLTRAGWRAMLERSDGITVNGEAETARRIETALATSPADVVVIDPRLESGAGFEAIRRIRRRSPQTSVVVVTSADRPHSARRYLEAGALSYLSKTDTPEDLTEAIRAAADGDAYRQSSLPQLLKLDPEMTLEEGISERERDVLRLLALGHTNREIARILYLSVRTVESHRASLLRKLGASSRADLVAFSLRNGLLDGAI
jgi:two-component system response regulator NreC